jgi:hypothetical protein
VQPERKGPITVDRSGLREPLTAGEKGLSAVALGKDPRITTSKGFTWITTARACGCADVTAMAENGDAIQAWLASPDGGASEGSSVWRGRQRGHDGKGDDGAGTKARATTTRVPRRGRGRVLPRGGRPKGEEISRHGLGSGKEGSVRDLGAEIERPRFSFYPFVGLVWHGINGAERHRRGHGGGPTCRCQDRRGMRGRTKQRMSHDDSVHVLFSLDVRDIWSCMWWVVSGHGSRDGRPCSIIIDHEKSNPCNTCGKKRGTRRNDSKNGMKLMSCLVSP